MPWRAVKMSAAPAPTPAPAGSRPEEFECLRGVPEEYSIGTNPSQSQNSSSNTDGSWADIACWPIASANRVGASGSDESWPSPKEDPLKMANHKLNAKMDAMSTKMEAMGNKIEALKMDKDLDAWVYSNANKKLDAWLLAMGEKMDKLDAMAKNMDRLDTKLDAMATKMDKLDAIKTKVESMGWRVDQLDSKIERKMEDLVKATQGWNERWQAR